MLVPEGMKIGRYQVVGAIGSGGMGAVYEGHDAELDRRVAIKVLRADIAGASGRAADDIAERFLREARATARLNHLNIVRIYDIGRDEHGAFLVQEFLDGRTLHQLLREVSIPLPSALDILAQVADGLHAAHTAGIVHRDVKPSNIYILDGGLVKIIDFGIAALDRSHGSDLTRDAFIGTPAYSSPEQMMGEAIDARSDMFAFGAVAFETITGRKAFEGDSVFATMRRVVESPPPRVTALVPECPAALDALVLACLAREPARRPGSMAEIARQLRAVRAALPDTAVALRTSPPPAGPPSPAAVAPSLSPPATQLERWPPEPPPAPRPPAPLAPAEIAEGTLAGPVVSIDPTIVSARRSDGSGVADTVLPPPPGTVPPPPRGPGPATAPVGRSAPAARSPGARVGRFTIHELVASGQTGHLYKAFDPVRSKLVGLKVIDSPSGIAVQRLLRASRIWLDLHHGNLQRIYEVDPGGEGEPALVATQLIEGVDLGVMLKQNRLDLAQKIDVILQLCDALEYLHNHGVIHREVKPRNIVLSTPDLRVTLLDSGLARSTDLSEVSYTVTGMVVGDLAYMAPEQMQRRFDQRSDVYSAGVVLYEMMTGRAASLEDLVTVSDRLQSAPHLPAAIVAALRAALQQDPERRCGSVREFADMLRALVPERMVPVDVSKVVVTLHGIRTHARWQRAFAEVASAAGLQCRLDRWNFGRFSLFQFLAPWSRAAKLEWFRATYHEEFGDLTRSLLSTERPSIVAHSFGTYILGHALLRYPYLRFNKVLLCGSILPVDFPWDALIDRGQVQAVRNEYGARDVWTQIGQRFVARTGASGTHGFRCSHDRFEQEAFDYSHSEYFERGHMADRWIPFLRRRVVHITPREHPLDRPGAATSWGTRLLYAATFGTLALAALKLLL